jgi:hypothetical protein
MLIRQKRMILQVLTSAHSSPTPPDRNVARFWCAEKCERDRSIDREERGWEVGLLVILGIHSNSIQSENDYIWLV